MNHEGMKDKFSLLEETIKVECGRGPVYYFANPGNWGDALIRHGTLKFFQDINLNYRELRNYKKRSKRVFPYYGTIIYGGGGAWCKLWNHAEDIVKKLKKKYGLKIIVLPSSYELNYAIPKTMFFCRDKFESKQNMPNTTFCHDMAFYIGIQNVLKEKGSGKGYFFRTDEESAKKIRIPSENNDISSKGHTFSEGAGFFEEINRFSVVYTDRMHVAIAGCLLEKEVHLYAGSYFKIRAVYLSSMKDNFDNVYFHEEFDF